MAIIVLCSHCGTPKGITGGKYCGYCNSVEKRKTMDEANAAIFEAAKLPFVCTGDHRHSPAPRDADPS